ncbi:MAG: glycosyltransferase family 4 protein, partial [bacterium]|nr:glycosyltransferase family 4 protein [bacterium]
KQDDVESIVNLFNVGVLACNTNGHAEGMPNSIMEYMALGKPVVATDSGGNRELVVHDETGFIVKPFDAAELTARLLYLLDHPDRANQMGMRGKKRIEEKFSLERMVKGYVSLYRGMCK